MKTKEEKHEVLEPQFNAHPVILVWAKLILFLKSVILHTKKTQIKWNSRGGGGGGGSG